MYIKVTFYFPRTFHVPYINIYFTIIYMVTLIIIPNKKYVFLQGGKYFYFEHVAADENSFTSRVQNLLTKPWRFMFDGCTLSRHVHRHLQAAGFSTLDFKRSWPTNVSNILFLMKTTLIGTATK